MVIGTAARSQSGASLPDAATTAPRVELSAENVAFGEVARLQAAASEAHGPVLAGNVPSGPDAGPCLYLVGPGAHELALTKRVAAFSSDDGWRHVLGHGCGRAVLNTDDPAHAEERRMWAPALSNTAIHRHWSAVNRTIDECIEPLGDGAEFDAYRTLRTLAYRAAAETLAGLPREAVEPSYRALRIVLDGQDFAHESRESYVERANAARAELRTIFLDIIGERRRRPRVGAISLLDQLLARSRFADAVTDDQIRAHLTILLIAAHDTGATLFSRAVYLLAERADIAERLALEVATTDHTADHPAAPAALDRLPCLQRLLLETGRLYPSLINLPRVVVEEVDFGGFKISPGTRVALASAATHLLSRLYADPLRFDLERYRDPFDTRVTQSFAMLTFSGGARMCMGKRFAQLEFKAIVASVVSRLKLKAVGGAVAHAGFWAPRPAGPLSVVARSR